MIRWKADSMQNPSLFNPQPKRIASKYSSDAEITLFHGDVNTLLETIPDESVHLVVTSPPYNLGKEYEDRVSIENYLGNQSMAIAELVRVLSPRGSICWQVGNFVENGEVYPLDVLYYPLFKQHDLRLRNRIVWHFGHGLHTSKRFSGRYETILWFSKTDEYTFNLDPVRVPSKYPGKRHYKGPNKGKPSGNPKGKNPSDVWEGFSLADEWEACFWEIPNVKSNHPEKTVHPCQFPVELVERCVLALTDPGDLVFDPYAGVGSALIAAIRHARRALGAEQNKEYVEIAHDRIEAQINGTLRVRPLGKPVFKPTGRERVSQVPPEWEQSEQQRLLEESGNYE